MAGSLTTFYIHRTSRFDDFEYPPCDGCYRGKRRYIDQRTFATVGEHDQKLGRAWTERGVEHGTNNTGIYRYFEEEAWLIDIASLDELMAFLEKHGECVLKAEQGATPAIEIYDYRE